VDSVTQRQGAEPPGGAAAPRVVQAHTGKLSAGIRSSAEAGKRRVDQ